MAQDLMSLIHKAGFTGQAADIMYGIVMAESGGNAHSLNDNPSTGDLSYGLAQINMIGAMGPERLKEYGLSSNNELYDPLTNLKVAYALSNGGKDFTPWSTYKSGAYQTYMGGDYSAQVSSSGSGGGGNMGGDPTMSDYNAVDSLGNLLDSVPALKKLVNQALANGWTVAKFQNQVEDSAWWKNHSDTARQVLITQANDPATYQQNLGNAEFQIRSLSQQLGMDLSKDQVEAIARTSLLTGNTGNTDWLKHQIGKSEDYSGIKTTDNLSGEMAANAQQLQQLAGAYGVRLTPEQIAHRAKMVAMGVTTLDTYRQQAIGYAKSAFPSFAKQLDEGQTMMDIANPYISSASQILELDPAKFDLYNPLIRKGLQGTTAKPGEPPSSMPLWQFENTVRQDPRWQYTNNAKQNAASMLLQLGQSWGFNG